MQIGRYRILGELGRGAMGVVYRAQDPTIGRTIAIKSIRLGEMSDETERARLHERLFREAQSAGILSHPNIVTIYDIQEENGLAYIFMEFVDGAPLDDFLQSTEPPTPAELLQILSQTAEGLDYAHKRGIIHRDIKPANIMVHDRNTAKVCDFGVAKIASQQLTQTGLLLGTPSYMSPEQLQGEAVDGRSDQFALAVMVYELLSGKKPFTGESIPALIFRICRDDPPAIADANPTVGPLLDTVMRRALAKRPDERYDSCAKFMAFVRRALEGREWAIPITRRAGLDDATTASGGKDKSSLPLVTLDEADKETTSSGELVAPPAREPSGGVQAKEPSTGSLPAPVSPAFTAEPFRPQPQKPATPISDTAATGSQSALPNPLPQRELPVRRLDEPATAKSKAWMAIPVIALLAGGGFFGWKQFSEGSNPEPKPKETVNEEPKQEAPKAAAPKPVTPPPAPPPPKQEETPTPEPPKVEPAKVEDPKVEPAKPVETPLAVPGAGQQVQFTSVPPGAFVVVDNETEHSCKTPCALSLPRGRHTLLASLDGYVAASRIFQVPESTAVSVSLDVDGGIITVVTDPPGATISVNGQLQQGKVTPATLNLRVGTYQIEVAKDGRKQTETVNVRRNGVQTMRIGWQ